MTKQDICEGLVSFSLFLNEGVSTQIFILLDIRDLKKMIEMHSSILLKSTMWYAQFVFYYIS